VSLKQGHPQDGVLLLPPVSDRGHDGPNPVVVTCHGPMRWCRAFFLCLPAAYLSPSSIAKIRPIGLLRLIPPDLAVAAAIHQIRLNVRLTKKQGLKKRRGRGRRERRLDNLRGSALYHKRTEQILSGRHKLRCQTEVLVGDERLRWASMQRF